MRFARNKKTLIVFALGVLSFVTVGCNIFYASFETLIGIYRLTIKYDDFESVLTKRIQINANGTITVLDHEGILGGDIPTTASMTQDKDKVRLNFAGPIPGGAVSSVFNGTLKDNNGSSIGDGTWQATYTGEDAFTVTGTWTAIRE